MKPVGQIYALAVTDLPENKKGTDYFDKKYKELLKTKETIKAEEKMKEIRDKEASNIILYGILRKAENKKKKTKEIKDTLKVNRNK